MFQITMTICSILHGATCKEAELLYVDEGQSMMPYACMIGGMIELAKWSEAHPNWTVSRWKCGKAGQYAKA